MFSTASAGPKVILLHPKAGKIERKLKSQECFKLGKGICDGQVANHCRQNRLHHSWQE